MIRSMVFTTQGRLHSQDIEMFLMPTLLSDTNLFLWVDLDDPKPEEAKYVLEDVFHFHPLSIEDCVMVSEAPKVEEYQPREEDRFAPYLFMVIHAVDYSRKDGVFATKELNFFLGKNYLVTYHEGPIRSVQMTEDRAVKGAGGIARAPDRVAYNLLDAIVDNYKPALEELSLEIADLEQLVMQEPTKETLNKILQIKKEVLHLRQIIGPQREVLARFSRGELKLILDHLVPYYRDVAGLPQHVVEPDGGSREAPHAHHGHHDAADDDWHLVRHELPQHARAVTRLLGGAGGDGPLHRADVVVLQEEEMVLVNPDSPIQRTGLEGRHRVVLPAFTLATARGRPHC